METERDQILREFRTELTELQKEFNARTRGLLVRIATELGEVAQTPREMEFVSPYLKNGKEKVRCGRL